MKKILLFLLIFTVKPALADLQSEIMNDRLDRLDREMTLLQKKVYSVIRDPNTPSSTSDTPAETLAEVYTQLEEQAKTIAELTSKVEELTHAQDLLRSDFQKMRSDTDVRFQETQKVPPPPSKPTTEKLSDKEAYDHAYNLMIKAKYPEAEKAFLSFLQDYPKSDLTGNANYWLGETYYVRGQYEVAAGIFSDGLTKYKDSSKAPDNLLKLGLTMANLGKKDEACGFFKLMPEQFPKASTTLKKRAEQEAKKLSCP